MDPKWWYIYARLMCTLYCQGVSGEVVSIISEIDFLLKVEILQKALWSSEHAGGSVLSKTPQNKKNTTFETIVAA